ncbi:MAG: DUF1538 domain-containing protein [Thiobacillus sp.]|nr:DUF1538 domain-containing protein [Thiobacillus sp.]
MNIPTPSPEESPSATADTAPRYPYADYIRGSGSGVLHVSYNALAPQIEYAADGRPLPYHAPMLQLRPKEVARLLQPYVSVRFMDQVRAVVPLAIYLALFQILILRQLVEDAWLVTGGMFAVVVGLMLFMEGLKIGLMPFGTVIGEQLPRKLALPLVLIITLLLGIGVTFAEPAIGALKMAGQIVSVERAPYLYALLNEWSDALVLVVGASVGLAAVIGTLRFLYGWSLKPLIYFSLLLVMLPTLYMASDPQLVSVLGLAWDAGAVTTGPVTVPLVLALGVGISAAAGKGSGGLAGFGIVTLASLFPIAGVLFLALYVASVQSPADIIEAARQAAAVADAGVSAWYTRSPGVEIVAGVRAILPLVIFLFLVLSLILRERLANQAEIFLGIGLTILGMCVFNLGLTYGLSMLGNSAGNLVPTAFMEVAGIESSPLYRYGIGLTIALAFAWFLGFGATIAEPALSALGMTAEELTNGVFKKKTLIMAVSTGVACGIALGLAKLIFELPLVWLLAGSYAAAAGLTLLSSEAFVNVAWDSAGVTTGPVTVPLVLAMGLGFGSATQAVEGFGILCLASVGPIITVLVSGLWSSYKSRREVRAAAQAPSLSPLATAQEIL